MQKGMNCFRIKSTKTVFKKSNELGERSILKVPTECKAGLDMN